MSNVIEFSDLFAPNITEDVKNLADAVTEVGKNLENMLAGVKKEAQTLGEALAGVSSATKGGRDTTKVDSAQVDKLYEAYTQLSKMYEENQKTLKALLDTEKAQNERLAKAKTATDEYASALDKLRAQADLAKDALAKKYFDSNRTSLITKAIEDLVNLYAGGGTFQSPSTIHAKAQANYLKEVVLQSSVPDIGILRKEIKKLWELLA